MFYRAYPVEENEKDRLHFEKPRPEETRGMKRSNYDKVGNSMLWKLLLFSLHLQCFRAADLHFWVFDTLSWTRMA